MESPMNTRRHFNEASLSELAESIKSKGVLTPLLVREKPHKGKRYEILAGARRYRASKLAGVDQVPARICEMDDAAALEVITVENLQREDVHPLDEALGYRALMEKAKYDVESVAAKIGKSVSYVYQRLKLAELIPAAQKEFIADRITAGHAILVARLQRKDQEEALKHCFRHGDRDGSCSVRELSRYIEQNIHLDLHSAPFEKDDAGLVPAAGACTTCPKRTGFSPALFPDVAKKDTCTDRACFQAKHAAFVQRRKVELEADGDKVLLLTTDDGYGYRTGREKRPDVLTHDKWRKIAKSEKRCANITRGLVAQSERHYYRDDPKVGEVLEVCVNPKCKVHHGSSSSSYRRSPAEIARQKANERKERIKAEVRRRSFKAVLEAAPKKLGRRELERIAIAYIEEVQQDDKKLLVSALEIEIPEKKDRYRGKYRDYDAGLRKWAHAQDEAGLVRFLIALSFASDLGGHSWHAAAKGFMKAAAKDYGVKLDKIEREVATEERERTKAKKAREAKRAKKAAAPKKAKAKSPAAKKLNGAANGHAKGRAPKLHACERCGCDGLHACQPLGCAWDPAFKKKGRWVCTTPACVKAAKKSDGFIHRLHSSAKSQAAQASA